MKNLKNSINGLIPQDLAYLAGFLEGDGCLLAK